MVVTARRVAQLAHPVVIVLAVLPLIALAIDAMRDALGANPIEEAEIRTGVWTLRFLALTLSVTPVRTLLRIGGLAPYRRIFGLFTIQRPIAYSVIFAALFAARFVRPRRQLAVALSEER